MISVLLYLPPTVPPATKSAAIEKKCASNVGILFQRGKHCDVLVKCDQQTSLRRTPHCRTFPQPSPPATKSATIEKKCGLADHAASTVSVWRYSRSLVYVIPQQKPPTRASHCCTFPQPSPPATQSATF